MEQGGQGDTAAQAAEVREFLGGLSARERAAVADSAGDSSWTALHAAALHGDARSVAALLSTGAAAVNDVAAPLGGSAKASGISAEAAETRYGRQQWSALDRERRVLAADREAAERKHEETRGHVSEAQTALEQAQKQLREARAEESVALEDALRSATGVVAKAAEGLKIEQQKTQEAQNIREEAKAEYLNDEDYRAASEAEVELETVSEELLWALAAVSTEELRLHVEQLLTVDPEAGVHHSEGVWSFRAHEKRNDLDALTGQARILGVQPDAINAAISSRQPPAVALASLIVAAVQNKVNLARKARDGLRAKLAEAERTPVASAELATLQEALHEASAQLELVEPAKAQFLAERRQAKDEKEYDLARARRKAKERREKAELKGKHYLKADAAYERARGMEEQTRRQVQGLEDELKRLQDLSQTHTEKQDVVEKGSEGMVVDKRNKGGEWSQGFITSLEPLEVSRHASPPSSSGLHQFDLEGRNYDEVRFRPTDLQPLDEAIVEQHEQRKLEPPSGSELSAPSVSTLPPVAAPLRKLFLSPANREARRGEEGRSGPLLRLPL